MTLQVELSPEQEIWLKDAAARAGVDQRAVLLSVLERQRAVEDPLAGLSNDEEQLRREIGHQLPVEVRERHQALAAKCQREALTSEENREFIELIDIVEADQAARLARVLKLARMKGVAFEEMARQFGLLREVR